MVTYSTYSSSSNVSFHVFVSQNNIFLDLKQISPKMSSINNKSAPVDWKQLQQQKPYEIVLSGEKISKQIEDENGLSEIVYGIKSLNLLEITNTNALCTISAKIDQLANLTNLILQGNKLTSIPGK